MKLPIYVYATYNEFTKNWNYHTGPAGMETEGWVPVAEKEVQFDTLPDEVLRAGTVAAYRAEQQRIRADAEQKAMRIEQTIGDMLCLEDRRVAA